MSHEWSPPEIDNHLFGFVSVEGQIVRFALGCQLPHLHSERWSITITDETYRWGVNIKCYDVVVVKFGRAVMS